MFLHFGNYLNMNWLKTQGEENGKYSSPRTISYIQETLRKIRINIKKTVPISSPKGSISEASAPASLINFWNSGCSYFTSSTKKIFDAKSFQFSYEYQLFIIEKICLYFMLHLHPIRNRRFIWPWITPTPIKKYFSYKMFWYS